MKSVKLIKRVINNIIYISIFLLSGYFLINIVSADASLNSLKIGTVVIGDIHPILGQYTIEKLNTIFTWILWYDKDLAVFFHTFGTKTSDFATLSFYTKELWPHGILVDPSILNKLYEIAFNSAVEVTNNNASSILEIINHVSTTMIGSEYYELIKANPNYNYYFNHCLLEAVQNALDQNKTIHEMTSKVIIKLINKNIHVEW